MTRTNLTPRQLRERDQSLQDPTEVTVKFTLAKLMVLKEVCKAEQMDLPEYIEYAVEEIVRANLEDTGVIGENLQKELLKVWQKEIGDTE